MITTEQIVAYVDGELDADARADVEAAAATDADIAAQIEAHHNLRNGLMSAFAPVADEPVPQALLDALQAHSVPSATVLPFKPKALNSVLNRTWAMQAGAMAASLIIGIGLTLLMTRAPDADFTAKSGGLMARGELAHALSAQLASDTVAADAPRIGITFHDKTGALCRTFATQSNEGLACRDGASWRIDLAARTARKTEFAQAGSSLVMQAVENRIDGDPLDAAAERSARDVGWKAAR